MEMYLKVHIFRTFEMSDSSSDSDGEATAALDTDSEDDSEDEQLVNDILAAMHGSESESDSDEDNVAQVGHMAQNAQPAQVAQMAQMAQPAQAVQLAQPAQPGPQPATPQWNWDKNPANRNGQAPDTFIPNRAPGNYLPNNAAARDMDPAALFFLWWGEPLSIIQEHTNQCGREKAAKREKATGKKTTWQYVDSFEMQKFMAILIGMDLVEKPLVRDYWANDPLNVPAFGKIMSRDRFLTIYQHLRFNDAAEAKRNGTGDKTSPNYDPLFKIRPIVAALLFACATLRQPGRNVSIDEQLIKFRGRFKWRQVCELSHLRPACGPFLAVLFCNSAC